MSVFFWRKFKTICHGRWKWPGVGRCPYLLRVEADNLTRAVSQRIWGDRGAQRTELMSKLVNQSENVNSEVLDSGVATWERSTSKAFLVNSALLPMIQTRGHRQEASETESFDLRNFMSNVESQQQYLTRSSTPANVEDGDWNMAFVGAEGAPGSHCGADNKLCIHPCVTVDETTVSAEKPFIENEYQGLNSLRGHIHEFTTRTAGLFSLPALMWTRPTVSTPG